MRRHIFGASISSTLRIKEALLSSRASLMEALEEIEEALEEIEEALEEAEHEDFYSGKLIFRKKTNSCSNCLAQISQIPELHCERCNARKNAVEQCLEV